jgi:hypothetical protein
MQNDQQNTEGIELPAGVNVSALPTNGALHAYAVVDGGDRQELSIDLVSQTVNGTLTGIAPGNHGFTIEVVFRYDNNTEVMLARANLNMDVGSGSNSLTLEASSYTTSFDEDGDGVDNLAELNEGTDPTNPADQECVIGSSAIGGCVLG